MTMKILCLYSVLFLIYSGSTGTVEQEPPVTALADGYEVPATAPLLDDPESSNDRSKRADEPMVPVQLFASWCSTEQPQLMDTYYPTRPWTNNSTIDQMYAETKAYIQTFIREVSFKSNRDFNISDFPEKYGLFSFPPVLPVACYETAYVLESRFPDYGRGLIMAISYGRVHEVLETNSDYARLRRAFKRDMVRILRNMTKSDEHELYVQCWRWNPPVRTIAFRISTLLRSSSFETLAANYDMRYFNDLIKTFLEDIVVYEIIRQVCRAIGYRELPQITFFEWAGVKTKLKEIQKRIEAKWHETQLEQQVRDATLPPGFLAGLQTGEGKHSKEISNILASKYYIYTFRVTFYAGWSMDNARLICDSGANQKCMTKNDKLVLVRWKPILSMTPDYKTITVRGEVLPFSQLLSGHRYYTIYGAPGGLSELFGASGYLINLQKQNMYPALVSYVTGDWGRGGTMQQLPEIFPIFNNVLSTVASIKGKFMHMHSTVQKFLRFREAEDANDMFGQLEQTFTEIHIRFQRISEQLKPIMTYFRNKYTAFPDQTVELLRTARQDSNAYYAKRRLLPVETITNDQKQELSALAHTALQNLDTDMTKLRKGLQQGATFMETLSNESPIHSVAYLLVRLHQIADFMAYEIQFQFQRYICSLQFDAPIERSEMALAAENYAVRANTLIHDAVEHIIDYAADGMFKWHTKLRQELVKQVDVGVSTTDANRLAASLEEKFPWNKFAVAMYAKKFGVYVIPSLNEPLYGEMFFINPDYSMVQKNGDKVIIVNWVVRSRSQESRQESDEFGFSSEASDVVCDVGVQSIVQKLSNALNAKSLFIWRTYVATPPRHTEMHPPIIGDGRFNMPPEEGTCCGFATSYPMHSARKTCLYQMSGDCDPNCHYHYDHQVVIYALEHHVNDD